MTIETPEQLLLRIYDEEFGLRPINFSIKPVHVANGLMPWLVHRSYHSPALAQTLRRWVRNQKKGVDEERFSNETILAQYGSAFIGRNGLTADEEALNSFRMLARDAIGADDAVFPDSDQSSYTLANELFITRDPSDYRSGLFLARLLTAGADGDAASYLRELICTEDDPWTTLALPLLRLATAREENLSGEVANLAARADHLFSADADGRLACPSLRALRAAFDQLARFETREGSKVNSLRRLVLFGCFAIHVHLLTRWSEAVPDAPRPPIFVDMLDGSRSSVLDASRATVRAAGDAIEGLLIHRVREYLEAGHLDEDALVEPLPLKGPQQVRERAAAYHVEDLAGRADALTEAFVDVGLEETRGHPVNFLTELGRRTGYLVPWANQGRGGRLLKRYGFTAEFLEILVAAVVPPDDPLEFHEFLQRLHESFGIVVGRPQDDAAIRRNNLNPQQFGPPISISEDDLRANVEMLRRAVVETGYAKSYADGQTIVTAAPEGLVSR